ncbi:MAG: aromatic-ring-hydroxylating dioxygenase subunit beta [Pseudomonadota bacterium]
MALSLEAASRLLIREARCLDDGDYDKWLSLYDEDALYWAPVDRRQEEPTDGVSHVCDDIQLMAARVHRLKNPRVYSPEPAPLTARIVGNIEVDEDPDHPMLVRSSLLLLEFRDRGRFEEDQRTFGAKVEHRLRPSGDGLKIYRKRIDLINAVGALNAIAIPF